jgi:hypothetical protein
MGKLATRLGAPIPMGPPKSGRPTKCLARILRWFLTSGRSRKAQSALALVRVRGAFALLERLARSHFRTVFS